MTHTDQVTPAPQPRGATLTLPALFSIEETRVGNRIRQLGQPSLKLDGALVPTTVNRLKGMLFRVPAGDDVLILSNKRADLPEGYERILHAEIPEGEAAIDLSGAKWLKHPLMHNEPVSTDQLTGERRGVLESWTDAFSYVREDVDQGIVGFRGPQIGALHAIQAHWSLTNSPATIVLPTGTGKTETMLGVLVSNRCAKLLVVVPTDALRTQLASKFLSLGILKEPGSRILTGSAKRPVVTLLQHIPRTVDEVDEVFGCSHVIIATSSIAGQCDPVVQERMAHHCPYLFIDEAHHAEAPTWSAFKGRFQACRVLQFTATPFREDGKPLDGDIIYKYSLKRAREDGYFTEIQFKPVVEFNPIRSDEAIATKAVEQLRAEYEKGHILMARVGSVERANEVFQLYNRYPEFKPVELHTGIKSPRQREVIRQQVISGESRIVVCVDMLGEGFDLPELKIAAFHDIRKTLAVTLQLAGRFTRARPDLGAATFIANTADVNVQDELRKLYSRDPDWNVLLPDLSERLIGRQISLQEFLRGFTEFTDHIPLNTVRPALSTVVYRTTCDAWSPENFRSGMPGIDACEQVYESINGAKNTLVVVTARRSQPEWTDVEGVYGLVWELYVAIWSPAQSLLFINSSGNAGMYKSLAKAVAGDDVHLISGQEVFRSFAGVNRLRLQSVGLTEQLGRNVRYTGRMGADVEPALPDVQRRRARKSVLSGTGFENGQRTTVGASRKGRIWSFRRDHVDGLAIWCRQVGAKLVDEGIDPDDVLRGTLKAETITTRPSKVPIAVDWPEEVYAGAEAMWSITIGDRTFPLAEVGIELTRLAPDGPLGFAVSSETAQAEFVLELFEADDVPNFRILAQSAEVVEIRRGANTQPVSIVEFFDDEPPVIWFVDGSSLEGNQYVELKNQRPPYDSSKISTWDWSGIDLRKESQGPAKDVDSIQARVIRDLKTRDYAVIVDDDGAGEVADVVAIRLLGDQSSPSSIDVELYHCKYSAADAPGQRIEDLYEVCGQAQKSISWMGSPEKQADIFTHLLRRDSLRQDTGRGSRIELGDRDVLVTIREMSHLRPVMLKIFIVQPGMSKGRATRNQLELLSVTENHLMETYQLPFGVIVSA